MLASFLFFPYTVKAAPPVIINEVAWMGTTTSANDEWIELYNNTENPITLDGWALKSADGTPEIELTGAIPANGFYLLERTNDDTVPGISADKIYTGALNNNGELLKLYDASNNIIDTVDCANAWLTGDNTTKQTMERISSAEWQISENPGGTPKSRDSAGVAAEANAGQIPPETLQVPAEPIVERTETPQNSPSPVAKQSYPSGIIFNEILPSPDGPDETEEWIELYNQNNFEVDISEWKIQDTEGSATTYTFSANTKMGPNKYLVLTRPETKITLNNTGDGLTLLQPDDKIIDKVLYNKAPRNQSYNRTDLDWAWSAELTPGKKNIVSALEKSAETQNSMAGQEGENDVNKKLLAAALTQNPSSFNFGKFGFLFLAAIVISILFVIIFYVIKIKLIKK